MNELALKRNPSKFLRELNAIITIAARDISLTIKSPASIIMSLALPAVMMGMLGGSLAQNMASGLGFNYDQFMMIGMVVNMLFMTTTINMASLVEDRNKNFMQEMMIAPISRYSIVIGKIFGSSFSAIVGMVGTLIVGLFMGIVLNLGQLIMLLTLSPLMCLSAGAIAMMIIGLIKSSRMANIAMMLVTMPQMFLSGVIIPIGNSSGILFVLSRLMPMTYCLDLARAVVYAGTTEYGSMVLFNPAVNFAVILTLTIAFLIIGTFFFARVEKKR